MVCCLSASPLPLYKSVVTSFCAIESGRFEMITTVGQASVKDRGYWFENVVGTPFLAFPAAL